MFTIEKQRKYDEESRSKIRASEVLKFTNPAQFKYDKDNPIEPTPEMLVGMAFHYYMINPETIEDQFTFLYKNMLPYPDCTYAKIENKIYRDKLAEKCENEGKYLIVVDNKINNIISEFSLMRSSILSKKINILEDNNKIKSEVWIQDILLEGLSEQSFYPIDNETGLHLAMRPDFYTKNRGGIIIDYKTDRDISTFGKRAVFDNVIKEVMYLDYISKEIDYQLKHIFYLVVEKKPPFLSALFKVSDEVIYYARLEYRKRLNIISECYKTNNFPGYEYETPSGFFLIELPNFLK